MKLSEFKKLLDSTAELYFVLPGGEQIPSHFHITEVGMTTKQFTDCGNTFRVSKKATFQLWTSKDLNHRLESTKILKIINATDSIFEGEDLEIEIEYQKETVGKFGLEFQNGKFVLTNTQTDCLAKDDCGIPSKEKIKVSLKELQEPISCCAPNSNCC